MCVWSARNALAGVASGCVMSPSYYKCLKQKKKWCSWWVCTGKMSPQILVIAVVSEPQQMSGAENLGWGSGLSPMSEVFGSLAMP